MAYVLLIVRKTHLYSKCRSRFQRARGFKLIQIVQQEISRLVPTNCGSDYVQWHGTMANKHVQDLTLLRLYTSNRLLLTIALGGCEKRSTPAPLQLNQSVQRWHVRWRFLAYFNTIHHYEAIFEFPSQTRDIEPEKDFCFQFFGDIRNWSKKPFIIILPYVRNRNYKSPWGGKNL